MNDRKTYNIYGIGEIYDEDIPEDYHGNVDKLKFQIESIFKNLESEARKKGLNGIDVPMVTNDRNRINISIRREKNGCYTTSATSRDKNGIIKTFSRNDIKEIIMKQHNLECRVEGYQNINLQHFAQRYMAERNLREDIIMHQPDRQKGQSYDNQRNRKYDRKRKNRREEEVPGRT